jgi:hypothetical protein
MASAAPPSPAAGRAPSSRRRRQLQSWFWPGFAAGFLVLSIVSCGGLFAATGLGSLDLSDIQGSGLVWTPPPVQPTPVVAESTPGVTEIVAGEPGAFQPGEQARNITSTRVNLRQTPGYLGKPEGDVIAQVLPAEAVELLGDRAMADNLAWWLVRYRTGDGQTIEGWMAEATASGVQILGR